MGAPLGVLDITGTGATAAAKPADEAGDGTAQGAEAIDKRFDLLPEVVGPDIAGKLFQRLIDFADPAAQRRAG